MLSFCWLTILQKLLDYLEDRPTAYLDELQDFAYEEFGVHVSINTIWRTLASHKWSRKAVQRRAAERSLDLRLAWKGRQTNWGPYELVFIDGSGANERTGDRKYGWSPRGLPAAVSTPYQRSERWSVLPALTINGYLGDPLIVQGSITAEIFATWLELFVPPLCESRPGRRSVLVMDNASIHRSKRIQELYDAADVDLVFLPPYSPDFNPIEATFGDLKAWIKRNYKLAEGFEDFGGFLHYAIQQTGGCNARAHFRKAGYRVEE